MTTPPPPPPNQGGSPDPDPSRGAANAVPNPAIRLWRALSETPADGRPLYQRRRVLLPVMGVVAFAVGAVAGSGDVESLRAELVAAEEAVADAESSVERLEDEVDDLQSQLEEAGEAVASAERTAASAEEEARVELEREVDQRIEDAEADLAEQRAELDGRAAALDERDAAITTAEDIAARSEFGGGVHEVGVDIEPGKYKTDGGSSCYWEKRPVDSTGAMDIIDNDLPGGPTTVTIQDGILFKSQDCGTWTRVG